MAIDMPNANRHKSHSTMGLDGGCQQGVALGIPPLNRRPRARSY